ncbi:MAG: acyl-CoA dehydrogenase [Candidatus Aminicenantes bacterium]|nr:acyl-CoA dehydrogenase [Candidatus Aminicenantes bacterium]NIM84931.1 acyl-CoA dehydrogenase [Candidatus Aminicenantes bacterium]NIN24445.1 acyl-CoA dehydrogenase [Candidatus Aminicenantes bacterium]NIN48209.1 acyl-CoA dehydrogenase [Candidatus Aminicenantes bacterium]NIN91112.1 acyl-CoA dehydrogenase [Candidatus Aminicenantes bacterium]
MDFALTEEQIELKELTHQFAKNEMRPQAAEYDEKNEFPVEVMKKAFEVGFLTSGIPMEYGGTGFSNLDNAVVCEELAWGCSGMYTSMMANTLATTPVVLFGSDEQKKEYLTPLTREMSFACFGLTEREAGSDNSMIKTTAIKDGDYYIINGSKTFITNAGVAKTAVIFVSTDPSRGARGLSAFIVPMDTPGVTVGKHENKMGHRASNTAEIYFDDVKIPSGNLLRREGFGFIIAMKTLDLARPAVGAGAVGVARAAYEEALKYAQTRVQFGKPIASFQCNAFKLVDMITEIDAARLLVYRSAWMLDNKMKASKESAMAKIMATDVAMKVTVEAVQILGGYGYMKEYPVEKMMRDAKLFQIYEGTNEIQKHVISLEILGTLKNIG